MMLKIRRSHERGRTNLGWLDSYHTFSFAGYYDACHMGFGVLRVINDDTVAPGAGFETHPHQDMEIISYVLDGSLEHRDSMGNGSVIRPGDVQRMSAGTGITHSEFNHSQSEPVHFLQIWILPDRQGHRPGYEQINFPASERSGELRLVASQTGREGSLSLNQDADIYVGLLDGDAGVTLAAQPDRDLWIHVARGSLEINGQAMARGDGAAVTEPGTLDLNRGRDAEVLVFDMRRAS